MRASLHRLVAGVLLALTLGCAHAPPAAPSWIGAPWPETPAAPRARLATILPNPDAPPPAPSAWDRVVTFATGLSPEARRGPALVRPFGVAFDGDGALLVADPDGARVTRWSSRGEPTDLACHDAPWVAPLAVSAGPSGAVYVADGAVVRWTAAACQTLGASALQRPAALAVAGDRIFVADAATAEVVVLSLAGEAVARWTGGEGDDRLGAPAGVAVAPGGDLLVVDALSARLTRLSPEGRVVGAVGDLEGDGALARPKGVAVDEAGRTYVSDAGRDAVLVFGIDGVLEYTLGAPGDSPGRFAHPAGLAVRAGRLAVADSYNARIQVFELLGDRP